MSELTATDLRARLDYDAETGLFLRKIMRGASKSGWMTGCPNRFGHLVIGVAGKTYLAHRLAWLWSTGEWPKQEIDHINGNPADNRLCNLRDVSKTTNMENRRTARRDNKSTGLLGVTLHRPSGRWNAQIYSKGVRYHLGSHPTPEAAHAAYVSAKRQLHAGNTL